MTASASRAARTATPAQPETDQQIWLRLLAYMRGTQPDICRQWFEHLEPLEVVSGVLYVRAHSTQHRDYLNRTCLKPFNEAAQGATGRLISVRFLGPDEDPPTPVPGSSGTTPTANPTTPPSPTTPTTATAGGTPGPGHGQGHGQRGGPAVVTKSTAHAQFVHGARSGGRGGAPREGDPLRTGPIGEPSAQAVAAATADLSREGGERGGAPEHLYDDGLVLNPDYSFDNFVVGPGNRLAHAAALAVAKNPGRAYNPFFVHGSVGLGKTHLLQSICLAIKTERPEAVIYYTSCEGFVTQFMDAVAAGQMSRFRYKFRHVDVLVVDDIHFLAQRERTQEEFFHTFNALYQSHKQLVLSSDAPPEQIPDLEARLVSRFKSGMVAPLSPPCYETRVEILRNKARVRGFELPEDVACFIATRIDSNIRELEGAISQLQVLASVEGRPIDLTLAREALGGGEAGSQPKIQVQTIINAVTDYFGVKITDLQSKRRQRSIAQPRQVCMWLARRHTRYSLEEIGGYFGGRDHTTVMHAVRTVDDRCETDQEFAAVVRQLEDRIRAPGQS